MKAGSKKMKSLKKKLRHRLASRSASRRLAGGKKTRRRRRRRQHGGYSQYQNNMPMTPTYQVAGINIPSSQLALANRSPEVVLPNCTNCVDNYNHYLRAGFSSRGH